MSAQKPAIAVTRVTAPESGLPLGLCSHMELSSYAGGRKPVNEEPEAGLEPTTY